MQKIRFLFQFFFLLLIARLVLGLGSSDFEKWCPFGGLESLYLFVTDGSFTCSLGASNLYLLIAVLILTLIAKRAFCGWVCPIGTLTEWLGKLRDKFLPGKRFNPPEGIDKYLRSLKYFALIAIIYFTWKEKELIFRAFDPYYAMASKHGEDITFWAYIVLAFVFVGALVLKQPFCRYLCPLGAFLDIFGFFALIKIKRKSGTCIDCSLCDKVCDQGIIISKVDEVNALRCTQCLECIKVCPKKETLYVSGQKFLGKASWVAVPFLAGGLIFLSWFASSNFKIATFTWETEGISKPKNLKTEVVKVIGMKCRHSSMGIKDLLFGRNDDLKIEGYLKVRVFPAPKAGDLEVTYDPSKTSIEKIAKAIKINDKGSETPYRVILHIKPDLSSPDSLLKTLSKALDDSNQELFDACHEPGRVSYDFSRLVQVWRALFLEELRGDFDEKTGVLKLKGVIGGDAVPLNEIGIPMKSIKITKTNKGWKIIEADWSRFKL